MPPVSLLTCECEPLLDDRRIDPRAGNRRADADDDQQDQREEDPGPELRNLEGVGECRDHRWRVSEDAGYAERVRRPRTWRRMRYPDSRRMRIQRQRLIT